MQRWPAQSSPAARNVSVRGPLWGALGLILAMFLGMAEIVWAAASADGEPQAVEASGGSPADAAGQADPADPDVPAEEAIVIENRRERVHLPPQQTRLESLATQVPVSQQLMLEGAAGAFPALFRPASWSRPLGGVLILHDRDQHAAWPRFVEPLRLGLADQGWHTLSLNWPTEPPAVFPRQPRAVEASPSEGLPADEAEAPDELDQEENQAAAQVEERAEPDSAGAPAGAIPEDLEIKARIAAGIAHLQTLGIEHLVLLGVGDGGRLAAQYLAGQDHLRRDMKLALVWVALELDHQERHAPEPLFGQAPYPHVLDLVDSSDRARLEDAKERARVARRLGLEGYRQVRLPLFDAGRVPSPTAAQLVVKRLSSWLRGWAGRENRAGELEVESF